MNDFEAWRAIAGFEGFYSVSNIGRVRRDAPAQNSWPGRILKTAINASGYRLVSLYRPGYRGACREIHALVAQAFLGPRPDGMHTRHLDGDSLNNCVENLAYGTPSENAQDRIAHGRNRGATQTHCIRNHALAGSNLIPSNLRKGHRACASCDRARKLVARTPGLDLQATADRFYRELEDS